MKSQLVEDVKRLQQKIIFLESNIERQMIALEEEKKKSASFSVYLDKFGCYISNFLNLR